MGTTDFANSRPVMLIGIVFYAACSNASAQPQTQGAPTHSIDEWVSSGKVPDDPPTSAKTITRHKSQTKTQCVITDHTSARSTTDAYAAFNPNVDALWAGSLVGTLGLADSGLLNPVAALRAPLGATVTGAAIRASGKPLGTQSFTMAPASLAEYERGRRAAIGGGFLSAGGWSYNESEFHNFQQAMMELSLNAKWAGGGMGAQLDMSSSKASSKLIVEFKQRYYDVSVAAPHSPSVMFQRRQSVEELSRQANIENNPIGYVASVTYGRHILMSIESNASMSKLKGAMSASQGWLGGSVKLGISAEDQEIINQSNIKIYTIGDDPTKTLVVVNAKDKLAAMRAVIGARPASDALVKFGVPISFTVRYLKNNRFALVGLAEDFDVDAASARPTRSYTSAPLQCCSEDSCGNNDDHESRQVHPPAGCTFIPSTVKIVSEESRCEQSVGFTNQPSESKIEWNCFSAHKTLRGCSGFTRTHVEAQLLCNCD